MGRGGAGSSRKVVVGIALLLGLAACGSNETPATPIRSTSLPLQPHAPDIGGDIQPSVTDEIRVGLTANELKRIAEACAGASELTPGGTCLVALSEVIATAATREPSSVQTCSHSDYCLTVKLTSGPDFLELSEVRETDKICGSNPDGVCLRLLIPDAILPQVVASMPPSAGSPPATPTPQESPTQPTTPTEAPHPTQAPTGEQPPQPGPT